MTRERRMTDDDDDGDAVSRVQARGDEGKRRRARDGRETTMARDDEGAVTDGDARRAGRGAGILDGDGDGERDARARTTGDVERARKTEKGAERAGGGDEARMRGARATATRARRARGGERDADRRGEKSAGVGGTL